MLPSRVLKMTAELLATPLTTIFNQAIEENRWPSAWKRGEWIPIYKKEDPLDKVNYRPVTVLTAVDKIFEQLRANVCNFRESVDSREFLNFFIFCSNNLYSTLISKITLKLVTAIYFFRNQVKFEKL